MKKYISFLSAIMSLMILTNCSSDYEQFVDGDKVIDGKPTNILNPTFESLPGEIGLKWEIPADSNFLYLKITYFDHLEDIEKTEVTSIYTDELVVSDTREKFGDYSFKFQTFNSNNEASEVIELKAKSGRAPITETITSSRISLKDSQFSTDNQEPSEGPIKNLNDGNPNSFFHTRWSSPQVPLPQYIQINLEESIKNFSFAYQNRNGSQVGPEHLKVLISNNGEEWKEVAEFTSGLPSASQAIYNSPVIRSSDEFTYLRFLVTKTFGDRNYFNLAEFMLYNVQIDTYDPEA